MAKVSPLMILPPVVFAAIAGMFWAGMQKDNGNELPTALAGQAAPAVPSVTLGDLPVFTRETLNDGEVKLVNFWASWCGPCRAEHPNLEALAEQGVPIYGINYKDDPAKALAFLAELGNPYKALVADDSGRMALDWGVYGVPETYVVAGDGTILGRMAGPVVQRTIDDRLRPMLEAQGMTLE